MPIEDYGVWKASPVYYILEQHEDDPGSPHLSLYFDDRRGSTHHSGHKFSRTGGKRKKIYEPFRAAINIKSGNKHESRLVYWVNHDFHQHPIVNNLTDLSLGFHPLEDTEPVPASLRLDFIRSNLFKANTGRILPYDEPGRDNELIDVLEPEIKHAIDENADVYLFGAQFKTGNGIHDVHMNQGNIRQYKHDDGVFQDGGLLINYPHSGRWVGVFLGFASQAVHTNDISGHAISPETWVDYLSSEGKVIEKELIAAARNEREGPEVMARLLERRRYEVIITEKVVVAAASNEWRAVEVINLLLDKRGDEVKITEEVIVAAASNKRRGLKVMELLLEKRGTEVKVTEKVVVAAASNELEGTEVIDLLLQRRKEDDTAGDEYIWIRDLRSIGYSLQEIADLLLDKARDSPWIYFEPSDIRPYEIQSSRHIPGCAHQCCATHATRQTLESLSTEIDAKSVDTRNIAEIIDELCGIGGISPATRTMTDWIESAEFTEENRILAISYTPPTEQSPIHNFQNLNSRILRVLKGFCSAVGVTQANNLCCNSFTVLKLAHTNHESSSQDLGEVTPLNFKLVIDLVKALESAPKQLKLKEKVTFNGAYTFVRWQFSFSALGFYHTHKHTSVL
ncbi:hypothetical protein N7530_006165 [Penicillium desertorum]|uniref:Uncharacterized protein n=1 Tax=Penicillium desertorum TaxID=1303715 RepID=A0A9X0BM04_9EURO|nr:hypothetical protein N7530_006165 [Penicillium desertorum]